MKTKLQRNSIAAMARRENEEREELVRKYTQVDMDNAVVQAWWWGFQAGTNKEVVDAIKEVRK